MLIKTLFCWSKKLLETTSDNFFWSNKWSKNFSIICDQQFCLIKKAINQKTFWKIVWSAKLFYQHFFPDQQKLACWSKNVSDKKMISKKFLISNLLCSKNWFADQQKFCWSKNVWSKICLIKTVWSKCFWLKKSWSTKSFVFSNNMFRSAS